MAHKVELARMSFTEVAEIDMKRSVVLLPVGVLEQHGPAGPMGTDYILAERVAVEAAARLEGVYVAPTVTYGYSPTFQNFPGNLGLPYEVFKALLAAVVDRLVACGWRHIVYVNSHAGNDVVCEQVAREMREKHGIVMAHLSPWRIGMPLCRDLYAEMKDAITHGGAYTLAVMMALFPEDVDRSRMAPGKNRVLPGFEASSARSVTYRGVEVGLFLETDLLTANGASGDPAEATREKGEEALRRTVDYCVSFLPQYRRLVTDHFDEGGRYKG